MNKFYVYIALGIILIGAAVWVIFVPSIYNFPGEVRLLWFFVDAVALAIGVIGGIVLFGLAKDSEEKYKQQQNELRKKEEENARREKVYKAAKRAETKAAKEHKKANTCPNCGFHPMKKESVVIHEGSATRNVKHIFYKEVPIPGYIALTRNEVINAVLEPQSGTEIVSQEILTCPKCGYKKEKEPTTSYKWNGPNEIREVVRAY